MKGLPMNGLRALGLLFAMAIISSPALAQATGSGDLPGSNLKAGQKIPELSATDQFGKSQNFDSLKGPNGFVLLFFRSADW
jgi:cell envelope opacity-associated protein A